jgi:hypothetical protein
MSALAVRLFDANIINQANGAVIPNRMRALVFHGNAAVAAVPARGPMALTSYGSIAIQMACLVARHMELKWWQHFTSRARGPKQRLDENRIQKSLLKHERGWDGKIKLEKQACMTCSLKKPHVRAGSPTASVLWKKHKLHIAGA